MTGIVAVGSGACTSVGASAPASAAAVRAGLAMFQEHPWFVDKAGHAMTLAWAPYLSLEVPVADRLSSLARVAADEALLQLRDSGVPTAGPVRAVIGLPAPRPGLAVALAQEVMAGLRDWLISAHGVRDVEFHCVGHAAGLVALQRGIQLLADSACNLCLIGGVDSYVEPRTLEWLDSHDQLHSPTNSWGFVPGEAAGFVLMCRYETAQSLGLPRQLSVLSVADGRDPSPIRSENVGRGLTDALRKAFAACPPEIKIDRVLCDMNGERYRAEEYGFTAVRLAERFIEPGSYDSPADCWGDVGATSGPLFMALTAAAAAKGYASGPLTLAWTSSDSGERAAALLWAEVAG